MSLTIRAILAVILTSSFATAQEGGGGRAVDDSPFGGRGILTEVRTFDIDFPGGPLRELLEIVRAKDDSFQYVMFAHHIDENGLEVPTMQLKKVSAKQVMDVLNIDPGLDYRLEVEQIEGSTIFRVSVFGRQPTDAILRVFNLRPAAVQLAQQNKQWIGDIGNEELKPRLDEIMTAVSQAITTAAPGEKSPQISFHPPTCVLLIRGSASQVQAVEELIAALAPEGAFHAVRAMPGRPTSDPLAVKGVLLDAEAQNAALRDQIMMLTQQINQLRAAATTQPSAK